MEWDCARGQGASGSLGGEAIYAYEAQIDPFLRLQEGQFYTPALLCDWMLALLDPGPEARLLEPGCGAGAFLLRAYERNRLLHGLSLASSLAQLVGIERNADAAAVARSQLVQLAQLEGAKNPSPSIWEGSFLDVTLGVKIGVTAGVNTREGLGCFDVIVGNPPYVRQEHVRQNDGANYDAALDALRRHYADYLTVYPEQAVLFGRKADLYLLFFIQAALLLRSGGRLAFVTSNSWLNTTLGQSFRLFLLHFFKIRLLAESACERWFPDAAVNAVIVVLEKRAQFLQPGPDAHLSEKPARLPETEDAPVQMLRILRPLAEWMPDSSVPNYWQKLHSWAMNPELLPSALAVTALPVSTMQVEPMVRNWALALRAPAVLLSWLEQPALWRRLDCWGTVRYPLKTGINRFFYLSSKQLENWAIESEFLFPVIRSSRKIKHWYVDAEACDEFLFSCSFSLEELAKMGKTGALDYIQWGQSQVALPRQKRAQLVLWPHVTSVRSNHPGWYAIRPLSPPHLLCNRFLDQRFFFALCQGAVMEDQTFYGLTLHDEAQANGGAEFLAALLNSTLSFLLLEFNARTNLGEGVLQYARGDMAALPVLNPDLYDEQARIAITAAFLAMAKRPILPLDQELRQSDRRALDALVVRPLLPYLSNDNFGRAISEQDYCEQLTEALLARFTERRTMARSGHRRK